MKQGLKMKIALVIGHNEKTQGAYGNAGISEYEFNQTLLFEMRDRHMLPDIHQYVFVYRNYRIKSYKKAMIDLHRRIDEWGADVSIEFHFNSFPKPSVNGNEVLYCSKGGRKIAEVFDEALDELPNRDRGIKKVTKKQRGGGFCCRGRSKAIIVEPFFGKNQNLYVVDGEFRMDLMKAYQQGLERI